MKKIILALLCLAFVGTVEAQKSKGKKKPVKAAVATDNAATAATPGEKMPKFNFKNGETHDFGELNEGPLAEHVFEFTNTGKEPLIIQNASASCGCTTPDWPKEPILPGKTGKITVRYTTQGRPGPFTKSVFITSNASKENERKELFIKGVVKAKDGGQSATPSH